MKQHISPEDALACIGVSCIGYGCYLAWHPLGWLWAGAVFIGIAVLQTKGTKAS